MTLSKYSLRSARYSRLFFAFALLFSVQAHANDRWYDVEVLIFAQTKPDITQEQWPINQPFNQLADVLPSPNPLPLPAVLATSGISQPDLQQTASASLKLSPLPPSQMRLQDALKALARSKNFRPLIHTGWRQSISTSRDSFKVRLAAGKDYSEKYGLNGKLLSEGDEAALPYGLWELDGFLKLTSSRFLHAELDLVFRAIKPQPPITENQVPATTAPEIISGSQNTTAATGWQSTEQPQLLDELQFYRLTQGRRIKAKELSYFDHPLFGVLVELRPLENSASDEE